MIDTLSDFPRLPRAWWARASLVVLASLLGLGAGPLPGGPAAGKDLYGDPLPPGAVARLGTVRFRHSSWGVSGLAVTPNGKTVVSVGDDRDVCFWEIDTGRLQRRFHTGDLYVRGFALAPNAQLVALSGHKRVEGTLSSVEVVEFRNAVTGKVVREIVLKDERTGAGQVAFSPDGKLLLVATGAGLRMLDVATGTELLREKFPSGGRLPTFSRDGKWIAVGGEKVFIWDWQTGVAPREIAARPGGARSLDFSPDGKTLATGDDGPEGIRLWDVATGRLVRQFANDGLRDSLRVRYSPNGRYLVSAGDDRTALLFWDPRTGKQVRRIDVPRGWRYPGVVFTPDGRRLLTSSGGGAIHVIDVASGKEVSGRGDAHRERPSFVALRGDGTAVTAGDDGTVRFWDAATGQHRLAIDIGPKWVRGAAVSPDGKWLATSELGKDHAVRLWDTRTGQQVFRLAGHGRLGGHRLLAFSPDGKQLLSFGDDRYLRRWDVRTGKAVAEHRIVPPGVGLPDEDNAEPEFGLSQEGSFSPGGSLLIVRQHGLAVIDTKTAKEQVRVPLQEGAEAHIIGTAVSPDHKHLLASAWGTYKQLKLPDGRERFEQTGHTVSLFEVATGKQLHRLVLTREGRISWPAFSADGKRFAVGLGGVPARILLFDTATGKPAGVIEGVPAAVYSLAFSPDSKRLIGGLLDTTAVIWDIEKAIQK